MLLLMMLVRRRTTRLRRARLGRTVPWCYGFPFNTGLRHPQYLGVVLTLFGALPLVMSLGETRLWCDFAWKQQWNQHSEEGHPKLSETHENCFLSSWVGLGAHWAGMGPGCQYVCHIWSKTRVPKWSAWWCFEHDFPPEMSQFLGIPYFWTKPAIWVTWG